MSIGNQGGKQNDLILKLQKAAADNRGTLNANCLKTEHADAVTGRHQRESELAWTAWQVIVAAADVTQVSHGSCGRNRLMEEMQPFMMDVSTVGHRRRARAMQQRKGSSSLGASKQRVREFGSGVICMLLLLHYLLFYSTILYATVLY